MGFDMSELTGAFLDEADELLQLMEQEILKLEQQSESDEAVQNLFRAAHTLKGSSAAMGLDEMKSLTHEMEHVLDKVRNKSVQVHRRMIDVLFACLDQLKSMKLAFAGGETTATDISHLIMELQSTIVSSDEGQAEKKVVQKVEPQEEQQVDEQDYEIRIQLAEECMMRSIRALVIYNKIAEWGRMMHSCPALQELEQMEDDSALQTLIFTAAFTMSDKQLEDALLSLMDVAHVEVKRSAEQTDQATHPSAGKPPIEKVDRELANPAIEEAIPSKGRTSAVQGNMNHEADKRIPQTIRVDVERLEHLMNLVGELVIDQTRITQAGHILNQRYVSDDAVDDLVEINDHISRVVGELQESVMKVRMLPIEQLFNRFPRMVRDLAHALHKEIDLVIEGQETELDRTVIERIGDPLIHLIRNALDHGIESSEERVRAGKPGKGKLRIAAAHEENQVIITVEDDGAGIDPQKMRESAVRKGLISEEEAERLSDPDAVQLIFLPGFSTAAAVSDVSGRGVGMDIVRNDIELLNGIIDIESSVGQGTLFKIKLPLTLAIITGLLIKLNGRTFILPMSSVVEIVRLDPASIQTIKGDAVVVIRERVLPVIWLHDEFGFPRMQESKKQLPIVVVGTGEKRIALVVDELIGNQEIVVKSLGSLIGKINGITGATILGDGKVALILEVAGLYKIISRGER